MPYSYSAEGRIVTVAWYGTIAAADLEAFGQEMPKIGRSLGSAPDVLHTFEKVTGVGFDPTCIFEFSQRQRQIPIPNPIRVAMVATTMENEYLVTVFRTFNHTPNLEMRVFHDEASARRWLAGAAE